MQQDTEHLWQLVLKNAIAEADPRLVQAKIETAEHAIFHRIQAFSGGQNALEVHALFDALDAIRRLKARDVSSRLVAALERGTIAAETSATGFPLLTSKEGKYFWASTNATSGA